MSILRVLALSAAAGVAALATSAAQAQDARPGRPVTTVGPTRIDRGGPIVVTPGRPTIVGRGELRPRGNRGDRGDSHLRERLRNACFNDPTPPVPLCRRVFGDHDGSRGQ